jgi:hypothetical protein
MANPVLTRLDLAELQTGNGGVVDTSLQGGRLQRIDIKSATEIGQRV